jgi:TAP-like protein
VAAPRDVTVPLPNSVATRNAITGSRLVTIDRRVHVPLLSGQANDCLTGAVTGYPRTGRLPATDLAC